MLSEIILSRIWDYYKKTLAGTGERDLEARMPLDPPLSSAAPRTLRGDLFLDFILLPVLLLEPGKLNLFQTVLGNYPSKSVSDRMAFRLLGVDAVGTAGHAVTDGVSRSLFHVLLPSCGVYSHYQIDPTTPIENNNLFSFGVVRST
ncbi:MAG: hypothetical protein KBD73_04200 [Candidatus Magasanikbacteria bacterium]|nr:hypothetical protein [Candidatus Magasanikbacteria bacterium]